MDFDPREIAVAGIRGLNPYKPGKPISELEREYGVSNIIKLASNENPLGASPLAVEAMHSAMSDLHLYPDGNGFALKQALSRHTGLPQECITLGNGSNEILELLARTFVTPEHEVVFSQHAFAVYPIVTQAVGATAKVAPAKDWGHDLDTMAALVNGRTRLVFIANPNNPTGTWLEREALTSFLDQTPDSVIVVLDEAYFEYVQEADYPDGVDLLASYPNLVVTRTFSKIYGLAGIRIGYGLASPAITDLLNRARQPFNTNLLAQAGAEAALTDVDFVSKSRELNAAGYHWLGEQFSDLGLKSIPSVGNFISFQVGDALKTYEAMLREGVIVRPIEDYEMPGFLRVTIGSESENQRFVDALRRVI